MPKKEKPIYIKIRFNYDDYHAELLESLVVLPGVLSVEQMYPNDPALYNIALLTTSPEDLDQILEAASTYEFVEYAEVIDEPEIRGKGEDY